jgi:putative ABC transport system permease protein
MQWLDALRTRLRLLFARSTAEARMTQEFHLHIDLETEHLVRDEGLSPDEARRRATAAFGGVEQYKETMRDGRGLAWLSGLALDLKVGARMLVRYPGLTLVGGAAMAFGIAAGVGAFEIRTQFVNPSLPLDDGARIVGLRYWDSSANRPLPSSADDIARWQNGLTHVEGVSAFRLSSRNLITSDGRSEAEPVAEMSAAAFRVTRVPPLAGRTLIQADEDAGAPPVVVIGHDLWRRRFGGDPGVIGHNVQLGGRHATVVGIMPEGFAFPAAHGLWVPLAPGADSDLYVFGRLTRQASRAQAQAELDTIAARTAADSAEARDRLRPQLVPFARLMFDPGEIQIGLALGNAFVVMLLVLVCANVALLMFARAAARDTEIAVRSALGAGRARIVVQLFVEALALAGVAVAIGLVAARFGIRSILATMAAEARRPLPFWMTDDLTATTVIYAAGLTMVSAAIIGIIPALNVTGRGHQDRLRQSTAGGGGPQFRGVWTVVIAAQVAATVMFPAAAFMLHRSVVGQQARDIGFPADRFLSARLELDRERARTYAELERRVSAEPAVAGVTFTDRLPGTGHPIVRIEVEGERVPGTRATRHSSASASVASNFFDVLGAPPVAGRRFSGIDVESALPVAIVNQSFVTRVLRGQNPIGRRIRRARQDAADQPGRWLEIVGLVKDLGMFSNAEGAGFYEPLSPDRVEAFRAAVDVRGSPDTFAARFRDVAGEVEPTLQVHELMPLKAAGASGWLEFQYLSRVMAVLSAIALLLSLTALYSVTAFTVSRRTREIGVRLALGADRVRVVGPLVRRPLTQVGIGVGAGAILAVLAFAAVSERAPGVAEFILIAAYSLLMMAICLLACVAPASRTFRVQPARALTADT